MASRPRGLEIRPGFLERVEVKPVSTGGIQNQLLGVEQLVDRVLEQGHDLRRDDQGTMAIGMNQIAVAHCHAEDLNLGSDLFHVDEAMPAEIAKRLADAQVSDPDALKLRSRSMMLKRAS